MRTSSGYSLLDDVHNQATMIAAIVLAVVLGLAKIVAAVIQRGGQ